MNQPSLSLAPDAHRQASGGARGWGVGLGRGARGRGATLGRSGRLRLQRLLRCRANRLRHWGVVLAGTLLRRACRPRVLAIVGLALLLVAGLAVPPQGFFVAAVALRPVVRCPMLRFGPVG